MDIKDSMDPYWKDFKLVYEQRIWKDFKLVYEQRIWKDLWSTKELSTFSAGIYLPWVLIDQRLEVVVLFVHSSHPKSKEKTTTRSGIGKRASSTAFVSPAITFPLLVDRKGFVKQAGMIVTRSTVEKSSAVRARRRRWPWIAILRKTKKIREGERTRK